MRKTLDLAGELSAKIAAFGEIIGGKADGGRVQVYLKNTDDFKVAFFGALVAGVKPVLLREARFEKGVFAVSDENFSNLNDESENLVREAKTANGSNLSLNGDEIFYLKTSGSTGEAKLVKKTLSQMINEAEFLARELKFEKSDEFLASVSHQNMFGLTFKVFLP